METDRDKQGNPVDEDTVSLGSLRELDSALEDAGNVERTPHGYVLVDNVETYDYPYLRTGNARLKKAQEALVAVAGRYKTRTKTDEEKTYRTAALLEELFENENLSPGELDDRMDTIIAKESLKGLVPTRKKSSLVGNGKNHKSGDGNH